MKRAALLVVLTLCAYLFLKHSLVFEEDPVATLVHSDPVKAALFEKYHENSFFKGKIFLDLTAATTAQGESLDALAKSLGYKQIPLINVSPDEMLQVLLPMLPVAEVAAKLTPQAVAARAQEALGMAELPGGDPLLTMLERDPLGFYPLAFKSVAGAVSANAAPGVAPRDIRIYQSPSPQSYDDIGKLYDALVAAGSNVWFIGGDFFAVENYRVVQRDIKFCMLWSLPLNILLFLIFSPRLEIAAFLIAGSAISFVSGLVFVGLAYHKIYGIVLAFTSTFVGFNTEYLVHLSGLDPRRRKQSWLKLASAIGTTFISFLVLLFADSVIVRQAALVCIGGMSGFLAFLWLYRDVLARIRYRTFAWPHIKASRAALGAFGMVLLGVGAWCGLPAVTTSIEAFRYQTPLLESQIGHFQEQSATVNLDNVHALAAVPSLVDAYANFRAALLKRGIKPTFHPLDIFQAEASQRQVTQLVNSSYAGAVGSLQTAVAALGLNLKLNQQSPLANHEASTSATNFLQAVSKASPVRWLADVGTKTYLFVALPKEAVPLASELGNSGGPLLPMSPKVYYDSLLTDSSRQLGVLFLVGLVVMAVYLLPLHRSLFKVYYIFLPLFLSFVALMIYFRWSGQTLNIVHFMGLELIIGVAIDYSAIAVSTEHADLELSKILLTGLATIASFGVFIFASHPVLRDLGIVVTVGAVFALAFALLVRLKHVKQTS